MPGRARSSVDRIAVVAHLGLAALTVVSAIRYGERHGWHDRTGLVMAFSAVLIAVDLAMLLIRRSARLAQLWLAGVCATWVALVTVAPSFVWPAFPLLYLCLRSLPGWASTLGAGAVTGVSIVALLRFSDRFDPSLVAGPIVVTALIAVTYHALARESAARQEVIELLTAARGRLAEEEHRAGVMAERQRLAIEVHDTVAQGLSSVLLLTQAAERELDHDPSAARTHLARATEQARHDLDEVRRIVHALSPPALDGGSLASALAEVCARPASADEPSVHFGVSGVPTATPTTVDTVLFRIAQEAVANSLRHARASRIDVTLSYLPGEVTLDVVDDGAGFDPTVANGHGPASGFGLRGMRTRVEQAGGTLTVETTAGAGTAVAASIPHPEAPDER